MLETLFELIKNHLESFVAELPCVAKNHETKIKLCDAYSNLGEGVTDVILPLKSA